VGDLTASEIEKLLSNKLAQGQYLNNAHVSVTVSGYNSKKFIVLGPVKQPGTYPLKAQERVLDALSKAGGIDFQQGGNELIIIRTQNSPNAGENKVVIRISLPALLNQGDQQSNLLLTNKDLLYIPKVEHFYILGQVQQPGSFPYLGQKITLVEAISMAGGFTEIAARNRTRIVRLDGNKETVIQVKVDAITGAGKKGQDVKILPGDVIVVPESFF
jgi:polysaccharide export outer membrane protein